MSTEPETVDIELIRGQAGLGFNIKGGVDIPHIEGDPGIFVAKIRDKGAAADDTRLREGDKIIEINGHNVEKVRHQDAVAHFLNAGSNVKLKVIQGAEGEIQKLKDKGNSSQAAKRPGQIQVNGHNQAAQWSNTSLTLLGLGALAIAVFVGYRYYKQKS